MKKLRVALIGYGRSGRDIHNHMFKQLTDKYEVTVGVEIDAQRRDMMRAELGIEPLDDYRKLVDVQDKFDFVVNASFSMDHAPISRYLLEHGMTVLSEKPAARDVADFEDILAAEKRGGGHYYVFQLCRFSPEFIKIKEIIAEGTLASCRSRCSTTASLAAGTGRPFIPGAPVRCATPARIPWTWRST